MCWNYSVSGNSDFLESVCGDEVGGLLPHRLVVDRRPVVGLQHVDGVKELLNLSPPVPFGPSAGRGPPVGRSVVPVAGVGIGTAVFVLDDHQIRWHLLKLIDQPLPFHFGQDASLIGSHGAAPVCYHRESTDVPPSLQSLLFPCETQPSSINSPRFNLAGPQGLRTAVCTLHGRKQSAHRRRGHLDFYWLITEERTGSRGLPLPSLLFFLSGRLGVVIGEQGRTARGFRTMEGSSTTWSVASTMMPLVTSSDSKLEYTCSRSAAGTCSTITAGNTDGSSS
ncbi:hypothetical protein EYF80_026383 [Liparis tanakae]|uniref:Uncharacterized protein n=1 Tax=Liparis tanakae TaxID=230148 RepID=A0A4Z2HC12_9TELE|nr:hypothetical protein EYF80_026383 [Liparis tanakae]